MSNIVSDPGLRLFWLGYQLYLLPETAYAGLLVGESVHEVEDVAGLLLGMNCLHCLAHLQELV